MSSFKSRILGYTPAERIQALLHLQQALKAHVTDPAYSGIDTILTRLIGLSGSKTLQTDRIWMELSAFASLPLYKLIIA